MHGINAVEGGGGGKNLHQKWPESVFPVVNLLRPTMKSVCRGGTSSIL